MTSIVNLAPAPKTNGGGLPAGGVKGYGIDRDFIARIANPSYRPFMAALAHKPALPSEQIPAVTVIAEEAQQLSDAKCEAMLARKRLANRKYFAALSPEKRKAMLEKKRLAYAKAH